MPSQPSSIPLLTSVAPLGAGAQAWISDIWGVLHNGRRAFPPASEACVRFRDQGGTVVLVTNAPFPAAEVAAMLSRLGISGNAYDAIVTSGDVTRGLVDAYRGGTVVHIGPDRYLGMFEGLDVQRTEDVEAGDAVVVTGLVDDERETPDDYRSRLARLRARNLVMICANPDIKVERGHRIVYCAGALAEAYEQIGGTVQYAGKPHAPIYDVALGIIDRAKGRPVPKASILAIGDGIHTDIAGAGAQALRAVFIGSALHIPEGRALDDVLLAELFDGNAHPPVAAMSVLAW